MISKNIWIINQYTGSPYHGMNYRSYYLAKEFINQGNSVTIFAGSYSHLFTNYPDVDDNFTKQIIDDIEYIWVKTPKYLKSKSIKRVFNMLVFMYRLFFFDTKKMKKPDAIIISSLSLFPVVNAYIWAKRFKINFIFEIRDLWPQTFIELGNVSKYHPLVLFLGWFERFGYKNSKKVVSLLSNAKNYMVSKGLKEDKFVYIPNGISLDEMDQIEPLDLKVISKIPKDKFIIGYVGTIGIANALEYLVESAIKLKDNSDILFVIVGKGSEKGKLERLVKNNNLNNVLFIEPIPKKQVQSILKLFDVCYIGWHNNNMYKYGISANKIFDYMYSSKPILHSISIDNDIVKNAKCGITIVAEDTEKIIETIIKLYNMDKEQLNEMGNNGKKYVLKYHSYHNLAKQYLEIL